MLQSLFSESNLSLEITGILLAVLSFSGMTLKIEQALSRLRDWIRRYTPVLRNGLIEFLPTPKNIRRYGEHALWTNSVYVSIYVIGMLSESDSRANLYAFYAIILPWTYWKFALATVLFIPALYMLWALIGFVGGVIVYIILSIIGGIFWVLSRPPSGVMGSIGLMIALSGPLFKLTTSG